MKINTNALVSISEANQNFSKVAKIVDQNGTVIILKNNNPRYVIIDYKEFEKIKSTSNEMIEEVAKEVLLRNIEAFGELAK